MSDTGHVKQTDGPDGAQATVNGQDSDGAIALAQLARLELDEPLEQRVSRARDVQNTQSRLRGLMRANLEVVRAVNTDQVLRHIVDAARGLVNARYAALGVVRQGRWVQFLHSGMDGPTVARIGAPPEGKGVLGRLVDYPQPLRLADIGGNMSSMGFPAHHPPMASFLGVPVRVGERVFGNLYLTEKQGAAEFTSDDEELAQALAAIAGVAIENALLFAETGRRQAWQNAMVAVVTQLLTGGNPRDALTQFVHYARVTSGSDGAAVCVPTDNPNMLRMTMTEGIYLPWLDQTVPREGSASGAALAAGRAVLVTDVWADTPTSAATPDAGLVGESVAVPMLGKGGALGVLMVSRSPANGTYDQTDLDMITAFATQAGLALKLAQARQDGELLHMMEDRQHIAEDLRHRVIQRLFLLGLSLQAAVPRIANDAPRAAVMDGIDELDAVIREIRAAVFALHTPLGEPAT